MPPLGFISSHLREEQVGVESKELRQKRHSDFSPRNNYTLNARSETILHFHYADKPSRLPTEKAWTVVVVNNERLNLHERWDYSYYIDN